MRRFTLCKDALRVKVFRNSPTHFDYQSLSTEELLLSGNDVRGGDTKILYQFGEDMLGMLDPAEEVPLDAKKLCTVVNEFSASNPKGKWKVLIESSTVPAGLAIPPGEV